MPEEKEQKTVRITKAEREEIVEALSGDGQSQTGKQEKMKSGRGKAEAPNLKTLPVIPTSVKKTSKSARLRPAAPNTKKGTRFDTFWLKTIPFFIVIIFLGLIVFINSGLYFVDSLRDPAKKLAISAHYPVLIFGTDVISFTDFDAELSTYTRLGASLLSQDVTSVSSADSTGIILTKLLRDAALAKGFKQYNVVVSEQDIDEAFLALFGTSRSSVTASAISEQIFGVRADDVVQYLLVPYLQKQKLTQALAQDPQESQKMLALAREAKDLIGDDEAVFQTYMSEQAGLEGTYRADALGYFESSNLPEAFEPIAGLSAGDISDVIESSVGFHILHVIDSIAQDDTTYLKLEQILFEKPDADFWVIHQLNDTRIFDLVPGYSWNPMCQQMLRSQHSCFSQPSTSGASTDLSEFDLQSLLVPQNP